MEQIKDMVTLRAFAVDKAFCSPTSDVIATAKLIAKYILGNAKLPESYEDKTMDVYKDFMKELAPKIPSWINPDDGLPCENQDILVICKDYEHSLMGTYRGIRGFEVYDADVVKSTLDGEIDVVAWLPIPEYKGHTI